MKFKTIKNSVVELIRYQKTLALMNGIQLTSWQALRAGIVSTTKAMAKWLVINPVGWGIIAVGAIASVVGIYDLLTTSVKEAQESLEESVDAFEESQNKLESLNDELKTCSERILELQKLADAGTISVADAEQLKLLKETNKELERKIALEQDENIRKGKEVLKTAKETSDAKVKSEYVSEWNEGSGTSVYQKVTAEEELEAAIQAYEWGLVRLEAFDEDEYASKDVAKNIRKGIESDIENAKDRAHEMQEIITSTVDAYRLLEESGYELDDSAKEEYERLKKSQDAYMLLNYNILKTKEAFRGLNTEQQKTILSNRLLEQGLSKEYVEAILNSISESDFDDYWDKDFSFVPPDFSDYTTAEEYGKAYAEAWMNGVRNTITRSKDYGVTVDLAKEKFGIYYQDKSVETFFDTYGINTDEQTLKFKEFVESSNSIFEVFEKYIDYYNSIQSIDKDVLITQKTLDNAKTYRDELGKLYDALALLRSGNATASDIYGFVEEFPGLSEYIGDLELLEEKIQELINERLVLLREQFNGAISEKALQNLAKMSVLYDSVFGSIDSTLSSIDKLTSSYKSLNQAITEYNENGYLSLDTLEQVMQLEPKYLASLVDEEGHLKDIVEVYKVLLDDKLKELEIDAYKKANLVQAQLRIDYAGNFNSQEYKDAFAESQRSLEQELEFIKVGREHIIDYVNEGFGSKSSSTSDFSEQIDWAANSVSNLERAVSKLEDEVENTKPWDEKIEKIKELNTELGKLKEGYGYQYSTYEKEFLDALNNGALAKAGLNDDFFEKLKSGNEWEIEEFIDKNIKSGETGTFQERYENAQEIMDWYQKMQDAEDKGLEIDVKINSNYDAIREEELKPFQLELDKLEAESQRIQNAIDLNGGKGTGEQYNELISIEQKRLELKNKILEKEREHLDYVAKNLGENTDEYKESLSTVNGLVDETDQIGKNIKNWELEKFNLVLDAISDKIDEINGQLEDNQDAIEEQDRFISGAIGILNQEIEVQEELRDAIQDKIDALQEENDEHERALALEKAKYELERARSQRTVKLYSGKDRGFIYTQNEEDVRSAQENLDNLEYEEMIHALEKQVKVYDDIIERLNEIKEEWSNIASKAQEALDIEYTLSVGGSGIRDAILGGTYNIQGLSNSYQSLLQQNGQLEETVDLWQEVHDRIQEVVDSYNEGLIEAEQCVHDMHQIFEGYSDALHLNTTEVDNWVLTLLRSFGLIDGSVDNLDGAVEYMDQKAKESTEEVDNALNATKEGAEETADTVTGELESATGEATTTVGNAASEITGILEGEAEAQKGVMQGFADDVNTTFANMVQRATEDASNAFQTFADQLVNIASNVQSQIATLLATAQSNIMAMQSLSGVADSINNDMLEKAKEQLVMIDDAPIKVLTDKGEVILTPLKSDLFDNAVNNSMMLDMMNGQGIIPKSLQTDYRDFKVNKENNTVIQYNTLTLPNINNENGYNKVVDALKELGMDATQHSKKK